MSWVELKLFARDPLTVAFTLAVPVFLLFVMGEAFASAPAEPGIYRGMDPIDYYAPAYIGLVIASMGLIGLPAHLAGYRERGVLRRFRASSVPATAMLGSQVVVTFVSSVVGSGLLLALAMTVYAARSPADPVGVSVAFLLGVLCFTAVGVLLGTVIPTARAAQGVGVLLWFVMMIFSGPGPPPEALGTGVGRVSGILVLTPVVRSIQDPWLGFGWSGSSLIVVAIVTAAALGVAMRSFRRP